MKKLTLLSTLAATIGTTAAWYVLSNKKLRGELAVAEGPEDTAKILKKYLGRDASTIANAVHEFMKSEEIQSGITKAKEMTEQSIAAAKWGFGGFVSHGRRLKDAALDTIVKKAE